MTIFTFIAVIVLAVMFYVHARSTRRSANNAAVQAGITSNGFVEVQPRILVLEKEVESLKAVVEQHHRTLEHNLRLAMIYRHTD